jgi:hypothetical protein
MGIAAQVEDAQHQVVDMSRAMMRLGWAMTVFGAQQAVEMATPSKMTKTGERLATALDEVTHAIEAHFGKGFHRAYETGTAFATSPVDGIPTFELYRAMQAIAMQPMVFGPMKTVMPSLVAAISASIPGRHVTLAKQECDAKMNVMELVQDVRKVCPEKSVFVPLPQIVEKGYGLGPYAALWAVEGIGHDLVASRKHRGESLDMLLTAKDVGDLPAKSLTMLHAGIGLGLAEHALEGLRPDSPAEKLDPALKLFLDRGKSSSKNGYLGCALESLGLVAKHLYGAAMTKTIDRRLEVLDESARGFFWHGVGRAIYFSPENMLPGLSSPWPAVAMCDDLAPHDLARKNLVAGLAWAMTMTNLRQPAVLEGFLEKHGYGFGDSEPFINGVMSSIIMRKDTTPDELSIDALLTHEPGGDAKARELWEKVMKQPLNRAVKEIHPVLAKKHRLGEIFRFQPLAEMAG